MISFSIHLPFSFENFHKTTLTINREILENIEYADFIIKLNNSQCYN